MKDEIDKDIIDQVIGAYGGIKATQERFGYREPMAVYNWRSRGLPKSLIAQIHVDTGIEIPKLQTGSTGQSLPAT